MYPDTHYLGKIVNVANKTALVEKDTPEKTNTIIKGSPKFRFQVGTYVIVLFPYSQKTTYYFITEEYKEQFKIKMTEASNEYEYAIVGSEVYIDELYL